MIMIRNNGFICASVALIVVLCGSCSHFNNPVAPLVRFTNDATDSRYGCDISMSTDCRIVSLTCDRLFEDSLNAFTARFFIKKRTADEVTSENLSSIPVDFNAEIIQAKTAGSQHLIKTQTRMAMVKKNGNRNDTSIYMDDYNGTTIYLPSELFQNLGIFFWQIEFNIAGETIRLPEKPGLWHYDPTMGAGDRENILWLYPQ
jgi:hypothetical protein